MSRLPASNRMSARDQLHLTRLKKQKLLLKDQIQKIIDQLIPPIIA